MEQLERVNSAMSNLATDNDRDVASQARAVNDLFKRTPVSLCPASAGSQCKWSMLLLACASSHMVVLLLNT